MNDYLQDAIKAAEEEHIKTIVDLVRKHDWTYDKAVTLVQNHSTFSDKKKTELANKAKAILQPRG